MPFDPVIIQDASNRLRELSQVITLQDHHIPEGYLTESLRQMVIDFVNDTRRRQNQDYLDVVTPTPSVFGIQQIRKTREQLREETRQWRDSQYREGPVNEPDL